MKLVLILFLISGCSTIEKFLQKNLDPVSKFKEPVFKVGWNKNIRPSYETGNLPVVFNSPKIYQKKVYVGHNKGYFQSYDLISGRQLWSVYDGGHYYSSPIIVDGAVIYGTSEGRVFSRSIDDGALNFEIVVGDPVESAPVHHNGRLFFHLRNHQVFCLDVKTGKTLWSYKKSIANSTTLQASSTPVVHDNYILVGFADGTLASLRIETGELRWEQTVGAGEKFNDVDSSPVVVGDRVFVYADGQQLISLDVKTGGVNNRLDYFPTSDLFSHGSFVYFGDKNGSAFKINKSSGEITTLKLKSESAIKYIRSWKNGMTIFNKEGEISYFPSDESSVSESFRIGSSGSSIISSPEIHGENLLVTSSLGRIVYFK